MNELATTNQQFTPLPLAELKEMSEQIAAAKMFAGITTPAQAFSLMMLAQAEGTHPVLALRRYHVIEMPGGRVVLGMRADAMQGDYESRGSLILWHVREDYECSATFVKAGKKLSAEARKEVIARAKERYKLQSKGIKNLEAKEKERLIELGEPDEMLIIRTMKEAAETRLATRWDADSKGWVFKKMWEQFPRQMLHSRCLTEGVRATDPGLIAGIMGSEEAEDARDIAAIVNLERAGQLETRKETAEAVAHEIVSTVEHPPMPLAQAKRLLDVRMNAVEKLKQAGASPEEIDGAESNVRDAALEVERAEKLEGSVRTFPMKIGQDAKAEVARAKTIEGAAEEIVKAMGVDKDDNLDLTPVKESVVNDTPKDWKEVISHIGKANGPMLGKKLDEVPHQVIKWLAEKWAPKAGKTPQDQDLLRAVLAAVAAGASEPPKEDAPKETQKPAGKVIAEAPELPLPGAEGLPEPEKGRKQAKNATTEPPSEPQKAQSAPGKAKLADWRTVPIHLESKVKGKTLVELDAPFIRAVQKQLLPKLMKKPMNERTAEDKALINAVAEAVNYLGINMDHAALQAEIVHRFDNLALLPAQGEQLLHEAGVIKEGETIGTLPEELARYIIEKWDSIREALREKLDPTPPPKEKKGKVK